MIGILRHRFAAVASVAILGAAIGVSAAEAASTRDGTAERPVLRHRPVKAPAARTAAARPLTIRRPRPAAPVDVVGDGFGTDYLVRQHGWDDPRLYRFGPFRTGGEVFYGDQAGSSITRGNAGLGQIAGYGGASGGFGGPHFDSVGGFHQGPGPDAEIDADYASGSLSRPELSGPEPGYPSVRQRVSTLNAGGPPRAETARPDASSGRRLVADRRGVDASSEEAKARFAAPMARRAPPEAGFDNGGPDFSDLEGADPF